MFGGGGRHIFGRILAPSIFLLPNQTSTTRCYNEPHLTATDPLVKARKLSLKDAQKLNVHCFKNKISADEINQILDFESNFIDSLGVARRDGKGIRRLDGQWSTTYLHTDGLFRREKYDILDKIKSLAMEADAAQNWNLLGSDPNGFTVRVIECHTVTKGGSLIDAHHCDRGSLVTIDLMCSCAQDFTGGRFMTLEPNDALVAHPFEFGDVIVFPSHKYHCVEPVKSGVRRVFVVELWEGVEKTCAHRCEDPSADCQYSKAHNNLEMIVKSPFPEVDPW